MSTVQHGKAGENSVKHPNKQGDISRFEIVFSVVIVTWVYDDQDLDLNENISLLLFHVFFVDKGTQASAV
ncbi:MAG: hypothetical protein K1563_12730 [Candidatus Thiodiazotropha sp. (ex. Lucinisca nassula)]|nr:hypothetical protein [Candidatus Thiodiazotropha sp. (ex. Lucinisca nassula)]MBW9274545.1 hypothetical protein [Candidatus Thiodiazotropha sp. (ex. Lucinisca nassula)]